jgi:thioredoxin 1
MAVSQTSDATFDAEVLQSDKPVLVDFWAEWCGPCRALAPKLEEIANELQAKMKVVKLNIDDNPESPSRYGVRGIPTLILFKAGTKVEEIVGHHPKENILAALSKHL